jgi:hypothetical protein
MMKMVIPGILLAVAAIVIFLVIVSPGKPGYCPARDSGRSICEKPPFIAWPSSSAG